MNTKVYPNVSGHWGVYTQHIPIYSFGYYDYQCYSPTNYGEIYGVFNALMQDVCRADWFIPWM